MSSTSEVDYNKLVVIGIGAIVASIIVNVAIYFVTEFLGLFPVTIINPTTQMSIDAFNVLFLTGFTATGGVVVYALLGKFRFTHTTRQIFSHSWPIVLYFEFYSYYNDSECGSHGSFISLCHAYC